MSKFGAHVALTIAVGVSISILVWNHIGKVAPLAGIVIFFASILLSWSFLALRSDDALDDSQAKGDPWTRLWAHKKTCFSALGALLSGVFLLFVDVALLGDSMVSAPWFNLGAETTPASAGFGHTVDPWAGFLIEGPGMLLTGAAFTIGEIPFWNPFEACGTPFAANGEMAVFSILQLPLNLWPSPGAWDAFALVRIFLVAAGGWLCAFAMGRSSRAALLVGFGLGTGGIFVLFSNLVHLNTALIIPWMVLATESLVARRSLKRWFALAAILALGFNGGNPQPLVCALVVYLPVLLLRPNMTWPQKSRIILAWGSAAFIAVLANAFSLLPLADLLARSENRTFYEIHIAGGANHLIDWFIPGGDLMGESEAGRFGPPWWRLGSVPCFLALVGLCAAVMRRDKRVLCLVAGLLVFLCFALFPFVTEFFQTLPIIGGLKWTKYATIAQFLILMIGAYGLDVAMIRLPLRTILLAIVIAAAIGSHAFYIQGRSSAGLSLPGILTIMLIVLMVGRLRLKWLLGLAPLLLLVESGIYRPNLPERAETLKIAEGLPKGSDLHEADWTPMESRTMAYRDAVAPLLSGVLGWYDIRSVGAFPLRDYHKFMAPYMNCGPWPPYMLLGASREIVLSPYLDLVGVERIVLRQGDFDEVIRDRRENLLENSGFVRFGEFQRALDFKSITSPSLIAPDAFAGSFLLLPGKPGKMRLRLSANKARIGFRFASPSNDPFTVRTGFGGDIQVVADETPLVFEINDARLPVEFYLDLQSKNPVTFTLTDWWVERHVTKGRLDFEPADTAESGALGLKLIRNKYALPLARVVHQSKILMPDELDEFLASFVATGKGWKHRQELLITPDPGQALPVFPAEAKQHNEEEAELERHRWNRMRASLDNQDPGWLTVAVAHDPGWSATINGNEIPIYRANGAFMAVPLSKTGAQTVEFNYLPPGFELGCWISGITILLLAGAGLISCRETLRQGDSPLSSGEQEKS